MVDLLFITLYFLFPVCIIMGMKKTGIEPFKAFIPSFVVLSMFAFAYIGTLPLYFGWNHYRFVTGVQNKLLVLDVFMMTSWSILAMVSGFVFAKDVLRISSPDKVQSPYRSLHSAELFCLIICFIFCCVVLYIYLTKIPALAVVVALKEGAKQAALARSLMGNDFAGKYHRYSWIMHDLLNLITFSFFAHWMILKSRKTFLLFFIIFLVATFTAVMGTEKAPFAWLTIGLFLTYTLVVNKTIIPIRALIKLAIALCVPLVFAYIYFMGSRNPILAMKSIFSRAFAGGIQSAYHYLEFFPSQHAFLMGGSFPNPVGIFPFEPYQLTVEIMKWRFPQEAETGIVGSSPTVFWGEMYANFGFFGVIFAPFILGIGLYFINSLIFKLENTPLKAGLLVWLILHFRTLAVTGLSEFIIDVPMYMILSLVILIIALSNNGKIKYLTKKYSDKII